MVYGAEEETRTPTGLRPPDPEPGASTTSATSAHQVFSHLSRDLSRPILWSQIVTYHETLMVLSANYSRTFMGLRRDSSLAGWFGVDDCVYYTDRDL